MAKLQGFGSDVRTAATDSYISLLRGDKKFGIVQITAERLDLGIKLKNAKPTERFRAAGSWNSMVTHRVKINNPEQLDDEILNWLKQAYDQAI